MGQPVGVNKVKAEKCLINDGSRCWKGEGFRQTAVDFSGAFALSDGNGTNNLWPAQAPLWAVVTVIVYLLAYNLLARG
jgi:hypothetical protein